MPQIPPGLGELSRSMLGAVMRNPVRERGVTCEVCTGPVVPQYRFCWRCYQDSHRLGFPVARRVIP